MITSDITVPRRLAAPSALALAVIALGGCGGSTKTTTVTRTNAPSQPATTTPAPNAAADERIARDAQLKLADFPSGWAQKDSTEESDLEAKCPSKEAAKAAASARQVSPKFSRNGTGASGFIYVYADGSRATQAFSQLSSQATRTCLAEAVAKAGSTEKGASIGKITTAQVSMPPIGHEHADGRLTIPIKAQGLNVDVHVDVVVVRTGRAVASLTLADLLSPFDTTLRDQLAKKVVDRLDSGLKQPA